MDHRISPERLRAHLTAVPDVNWHEVAEVDLVLACRANDPRARREVWDRYSRSVRNVLRRRLSEDVDDQVQETFIRVFQSMDKLREPSALRAFVLGIAFRVRHDEIRRLMRFRRLFTRTSDFQEEPEPEAVERSGEERESQRRLWSALEKSGEDTRVIFLLRHVEELELQEIAQILDVSLSTAKRRLERATQRVSVVLQADPGFRDLAGNRIVGGM